MISKIKSFVAAVSFAAVFVFASCNENKVVVTDEEPSEEISYLDSIKKASAEKIFSQIPSPIETAAILKKAGAKYDIGILNPVENKDKYATVKNRALNLGVYGTDLSFTAIFDKSQESMLYLSCTKKLADGLGITSAFNSEKIERIENNLNSRDSLLILITDSYWESDSYLKENDRGSVSALMVAGGWIEGLYIGSRLEKNLRETNTNEEMAQRIAEQKSSLSNLIDLLEAYRVDAPEIISPLKELKVIFDEISETESASSQADGMSTKTVGLDVQYSITSEHLDRISVIITALRNKIIS
jgi:hypothetical protein